MGRVGLLSRDLPLRISADSAALRLMRRVSFNAEARRTQRDAECLNSGGVFWSCPICRQRGLCYTGLSKGGEFMHLARGPRCASRLSRREKPGGHLRHFKDKLEKKLEKHCLSNLYFVVCP